MKRPNILVLAGHDPSGGAGLQADIESAAGNGAHAATVVTLLTCQDTRNVRCIEPVDDAFFGRCIDTVCTDMRFAAIKTGVVASTAQVHRIVSLMNTLPGVPLVLDPVLRAAGGGTLAGDPVGQALREYLFPLATLVTPNAAEARLLCQGEPDLNCCGEQLAARGCHVLVTGGDEHDDDVVNRLFAPDGRHCDYRWPRLAGIFHGSGCTLASAVAARLAVGDTLDDALAGAQNYTWQALSRAFAAGRGQAIPDRLGA